MDKILQLIGDAAQSFKGIELPAAILVGLLIILAIIWVLRDTNSSKVVAAVMPMATTLLTENTEKNDLVVELMRDQSDNKIKFFQLQNQMHQIEQRLEDAELSRKKLSDEIVLLNNRVKELTAQVEEEQSQKMELLKSIADLQRQLDVKDEEIAKLKTQLEEIQAHAAPAVEGD
jgi:septal ring factor EnvC (AmiA/AmiB activator)